MKAMSRRLIVLMLAAAAAAGQTPDEMVFTAVQ